MRKHSQGSEGIERPSPQVLIVAKDVIQHFVAFFIIYFPKGSLDFFIAHCARSHPFPVPAICVRTAPSCLCSSCSLFPFTYPSHLCSPALWEEISFSFWVQSLHSSKPPATPLHQLSARIKQDMESDFQSDLMDSFHPIRRTIETTCTLCPCIYLPKRHS